MEQLIEPTNYKEISEVNEIEYDHPDLETLELHERKFTQKPKVESMGANCHFTFKAAHYSGRRPLRVISTIVIHSTEGGTSRSVASWFTERASGGSTQLVVDDFTCYRCLEDNQIPWGAPGANYFGFHIEQCGYARWTTTLWSKTHRRTLMRAAYKAAYHCHKYGISPRFLTGAQLKRGIRDGITTHAECTKAFGGTHTDPGTGWPRTLFMALVRGYYATIRVRKIA